jgi:nitrogen-specific signal transduction histidine kinase
MAGLPAEGDGLLVERLAASLAHAVAGPLSLVTGRAELLARDAGSPELRLRIEALLEPVRRVVEILERAQKFGGSLRPERPEHDLSIELDTVQRLAEPASALGVTLTVERGQGASGSVVAGAVVDVITWLVGFAAGAGHPAIRVSGAGDELTVALEPGSGAVLPTTRQALLDPWLSGAADDARERLSLALALGLTLDLGGRYECSRAPDGATSLRVHLPVRSP